MIVLARVGGGDEFRAKTEPLERFFDEDGALDAEALAGVVEISELIAPADAGPGGFYGILVEVN